VTRILVGARHNGLMSESGVRPARMTDVDGVGEVNLASWRERLSGILPDEVLMSLSADDLAMAWASGVMNPPSPRHRLLVAAEDGRVLGYIALAPCTDPDSDDRTGEIVALEVDPAHQRQGHGSRLMTAAVDVARTEGFVSLAVWCPLADETRRAFWQSAGWEPDTALRDLLMSDDPTDEEEPTVLREARLMVAISDQG